MGNQKQEKDLELRKVNEAIGLVCNRQLGVLDASFLCQSLGVLNPEPPLSVEPEAPVCEVLLKLREARAGCVLVIEKSGKLAGIFSERDCMLKVIPEFEKMSKKPVSEVMTRDPVTQVVDATIGFALTLMSEGGFRHLPIVDAAGLPTAVISVKDVMDYIVRRLIDDVLAFDINTEQNS